ncbi:ACT domain containing protein ACR1-12 [Gracilaria domingensis]|nr:ACT domain containing protein ACR1-12 [Gracilaria domingensis]
MIVFAEDRHGLVLDVVSVLKALAVRVHRTASSENDALQFMLHRIEGELRSVRELGISLNNCVAFWITDEASGEKIFDDGNRLDQLTTCIKLELNTPYPRPRPATDDAWHRISVQKNRADRYTAISVQTTDRPRLLAELTNAFASISIDVASATINTFSERVENTFFVTKRGYKEPLSERDIKRAMKNVAQALLKVGQRDPSETLWYQVRDGTAVTIAEAIFIDEVNNRELAMFRFSQFETPNFRGRLPDVPYCPILPDENE